MVDNIWSKVPPINCDFLATTNYVNLMKTVQNSILESTSEEDTLNGFRNLRALLKYHPEVFITVFDNLYDSFKKYILNENQNIVINALVLINETFSQNCLEKQMGEWLSAMLPHIIKVSVISSENAKEIKEYSEKTLNIMATKGYQEEIVLIFLDAMNDDNEDITLLASKNLYIFLKSQVKSVMIDIYDWTEIFSRIFSLFIIKSKREIAMGIIKTLRDEIFDDNEFYNVLSRVESESLINLMQISSFDFGRVQKIKKSEIQD